MFKFFRIKTFKIQINFKSGQQLVLVVEKFKIKTSIDNEITALEWEGLKGQKQLYFRLSEIESIMEVKK